MKLSLMMAFNDYDRVAPIKSGQVPIDGCEVMFTTLGSEEIFMRAEKGAQWDVCELSFSRYIMHRDRNDGQYVGLPIFISRAFRHGAIFIRTNSGIRSPEDLRGRTVGVPEYQVTAALWARGILSDNYGVRAEEVHWRTGGLEQAGRAELLNIELPSKFDVTPIPSDRTLNELLVEGELDAIVSSKEPSSMARRPDLVGRLFSDYRKAELEYFKKSGLFPIMHVVVVKRELLERYSWLGPSIFKAFEQAKSIAIQRLLGAGIVPDTLPWLKAEIDQTIGTMGKNFWPYGVEANRGALEAAVRYSYEQGLSKRRVAVEELFPYLVEMDVKV